ncbi:MAG TPA: DoxX family protein [Chloroflexota bacterium]|nr:DoxX family protein [Chloroflexota bacterium]
MFNYENVTEAKGRVGIQDPPLARYLFQRTASAWLWLAVRLFVGYSFVEAAFRKFDNPAWMDGSGRGILGYWKAALGTMTSAVQGPAGAPVIKYDWYRSFIQLLVDTNSGGWFSYLIAFGELAVGVALILGAFVGVAAHGGLLMNMAYMLAGTTGANPVLALLGGLLILAWKNAGYIGLDYFLLPLIATRLRRPAAAAPTARVPIPAAQAA